MNWKLKFILLAVLSVPTFAGYPLVIFKTEAIPGLTYAWIAYFFAVNLFILTLAGPQFFSKVIAVAALISMPVVFVGGSISYLFFLSGLSYETGQSVYSTHYVSLCLTMLTVIPLALSMVAVIPFQQFEYKLLQNAAGVSKIEKFILMFLRVFTHIVYFVIPNILESLREEGQYRRWVKDELDSDARSSGLQKLLSLKRILVGLIAEMIQLRVEGICASIQYIPLWAVEISQLPDKKR
jgi:hypothetical protein